MDRAVLREAVTRLLQFGFRPSESYAQVSGRQAPIDQAELSLFHQSRIMLDPAGAIELQLLAFWAAGPKHAIAPLRLATV
jgi:hypothetical protein